MLIRNLAKSHNKNSNNTIACTGTAIAIVRQWLYSTYSNILIVNTCYSMSVSQLSRAFGLPQNEAKITCLAENHHKTSIWKSVVLE